MSISNFPNGVSSFGIPVLGGATVLGGGMYNGGNVYFVSSVNGNDANTGTDSTAPLKTLSKASSLCAADNGDVIILLPGHTETFSSSTAITLSIAGVTVIGLGSGKKRPTFTLDTATSSRINVSANNVAFVNCRFIANFAAIVTFFNLTTAADFQLLGCVFLDTDASHNALALVTTDSTSNHADGLVIDSCRWISQTASAAIAIVTPAGTNDRWIIRNNFVAAVSTSGAAIIPIASGKILTNLLLKDNVFNLKGASGTATGYLITTDGSTSSGFIDGNRSHNLATTPLLVTASSGFNYGLNYHADAADASGYLLPAADS